jgi:hypothetical protein
MEINPITRREWQQVLGGVKRREWSHRPLQNTEIGKDVHLGPMRVELAPISPHAGAAVPGTRMGGCTGPEELQALSVVHVCARNVTPQLWPH